MDKHIGIYESRSDALNAINNDLLKEPYIALYDENNKIIVKKKLSKPTLSGDPEINGR